MMYSVHFEMRIILLLLSITFVFSNYDAKALEKFWLEASDIVENIDEYRAFWIKPHGCVWSECAVDDTDDAYEGDNRDGDEQWYQYRTQDFCANAAYSLYGLKQNKLGVFGCTRGHFINSFFTYGGADILLNAVGRVPKVYYTDSNDDAGGYYATNSQCTQIYYNYDDDYNSNYASSLGCNARGKYIVAKFNSSSCDGNYFMNSIDSFKEYNKQHSTIGCHKISKDWNVGYLLNNSWSCDLNIYPNGCPDPYGKKARYDWALQTVARGGNARLAYNTMILKRPAQIISFILSVITLTFLSLGYYIVNRERIRSKGGNRKGYFRCLWEDFSILMSNLWNTISTACMNLINDNGSGKRKISRKNKKSRKHPWNGENNPPEVEGDEAVYDQYDTRYSNQEMT